MSVEPLPVSRRSRWWLRAAVAALAVLVLVVVAVVAISQWGGSEPNATGTISTSRATSSPPDPTSDVPTASTPAESKAPTSTDPVPGASVAGSSPSASPPAASAAPQQPAPAPTPRELPPVAITATAKPAPDVTAVVSRIEAVDGTAVMPGEIAGPALRVTVTVTNGRAKALDLSGAVVNLYEGPQRSPAVALTRPGGSPLPAGLAPGRSSTGIYVFNVPQDARADIAVELDLGPSWSIALFEGSAPA